MRPVIVEVRRCSKRSYANEGAARMALIECRARGRCENRYYHCSECGAWHLTSQPFRKAA